VAAGFRPAGVANTVEGHRASSPADAPETGPGGDGPLPLNGHPGRPGAAGRPSDHHPASANRPASVIRTRTTAPRSSPMRC
jgi:hypothetical protein